MTTPASTPSRRQRGSASTELALVEAAAQLFSEHGYQATSLDAIVAGAEVTKGALYHHFSGKQAIFEAAFEQVEHRASVGISEAMDSHDDPWVQAQAGVRAFLSAVQEPAYRQVVVSDGPSVLGHERFREHEERSTYAVVDRIVRSVRVAPRRGDARHLHPSVLRGDVGGRRVRRSERRPCRRGRPGRGRDRPRPDRPPTAAGERCRAARPGRVTTSRR